MRTVVKTNRGVNQCMTTLVYSLDVSLAKTNAKANNNTNSISNSIYFHQDFPQKPTVRQLNLCHFKGLLFIATETP